MYVYEQSTGRLIHADRVIATGYSGNGDGKNNPLAQHQQGVGPIPQGAYLLGEVRDTPTHGPVVMPLLPVTGTQTYGRSGFLVHGDSIAAPGTASHGCIILPRPVREQMAQSPDRLLVVLSGKEPT